MITMYTKDLCGYCSMAKAYLTKLDLEFGEINTDHDPDARTFMISEGHTTVPQLYHNNKLLIEGGCDGLTSLSSTEIRERMGDLGLSDLSL